MNDPQTSGGLLLAIPPEQLGGLLEKAGEAGQQLWVIGEAVEGTGIEVTA